MVAPEHPAKSASAGVETLFCIPATNLPARPHRTFQHNDTFAVFDSHGDIGAATCGHDGLFHGDTRYLSRLELLINGSQPLLLGSAIKDDNLNYYVDLTNPDIYASNAIILLKDTVHIGRTIYLFAGSVRERLVLTNHGADTVHFTLSVIFASDFADIFEVRGIRRARRGKVRSALLGAGGVALTYTGLDGKVRETTLTFEPAPSVLLDSVGTYSLHLAPGARRTIFVAASSGGALPKSTQSFFKGLVGLHREQRARTRDIATVETSNRVVNEVLCRSMADLNMLVTQTPEGRYPYAGIPWYSTTFGRDGLITALQMLWADPGLAISVLRRLAVRQATAEDRLTDASPGKSLHEMRAGEMARLREIPFGIYYGSVDSTPLFIVLAGCYAARTGDSTSIRELWPAIERALAWIDGPSDPDGDGFVEYAHGAATGLANQGWKDSFDSGFHADGQLPEGPIALCRGASVRVRGKEACGVLCMDPGHGGPGRCARFTSRSSTPAVRRRVLVRGHRHVRARARRRQETMQGTQQQRRSSAVHGYRQAATRASHRRRIVRPRLLFRLGYPHPGQG